MEYGAIDLHLKASLIRIVDGAGTVVLDRTISTTRDGFAQVFRRLGAPAGAAGERHGERVGGADD